MPTASFETRCCLGVHLLKELWHPPQKHADEIRATRTVRACVFPMAPPTVRGHDDERWAVDSLVIVGDTCPGTRFREHEVWW